VGKLRRLSKANGQEAGSERVKRARVPGLRALEQSPHFLHRGVGGQSGGFIEK